MSLSALLDAELAYAPEYEGNPLRAVTARGRQPGDSALASHLPMALHALAELGASEAVLHAWFEKARARVPTLPNWPALTQTEARLPRRSVPALLAQCLPDLLPHAGVVAFHALIRCAHAVEAGHEGQIRRALAWWSLHTMPVPQGAGVAHQPLQDWLRALQALPAPQRPRARLISGRMQDWIDHPPFARVAPTLHIDEGTLAALTRFTALRYAQTGNFTLLHGLTACRALMRLLPCVAPASRAEALRAASVHWAAAFLSSGAESGGEAPVAARDWPALRRAACTPSQDEHVIKLVHAVWQLDGDGDPLWRRAAERALLRH